MNLVISEKISTKAPTMEFIKELKDDTLSLTFDEKDDEYLIKED